MRTRIANARGLRRTLARHGSLALVLAAAGCGSRSGILGDLSTPPSIADRDGGAPGSNEPPAPLDGAAPVSASCDFSSAGAIARGQAHPLAIAVDEAFVYWINMTSQSVMRADKCGQQVTTFASSSNPISGLALDATNVYWVEAPSFETLAVVALAKGANAGDQPTTIATSAGWAEAIRAQLPGGDPIAVDDTSVYWGDNDTGVSNSSLFRAPKTGGATTTLATSQWSIGAIAVDATSVYWSSENGDSGVAAILRAPKAGGAVTTLAAGAGFEQGISGIFPIALDDSAVYFPQSSSILNVPKAGGVVATLVAGIVDDQTSAIAVDSKSVYWIDTPVQRGAPPARVHATGLSGAPDAVVADVTNHGSSILWVTLAEDARSLYWTEEGGGDVSRVDK